jgi:hypothetical protein
MRCRSIAVVAAFACAALLGCADKHHDSSVAIPLASPGPVSPDGRYDGIMQATSGNSQCGTQDSMTILIRNRSFHFVLRQPQVPDQSTRGFDVTIAPDGSFVSRNGPTSIGGTVSAGHMQGSIVGDACAFDFEADRTGTF